MSLSLQQIIFVAVFYFIAEFAVSNGQEKNVIQVLFSTRCSDSLRFIKDTLYPYWEKHASTTDLKLYPYGKAQTTEDEDGKKKIKCQFGERECALNEHWNCAIYCMENVNNWFRYLTCLAKLTKEIVTAMDDNWENNPCKNWILQPEQECINSHKSSGFCHKLHVEAGEATKEISNQMNVIIDYVPYLVINGKFIHRKEQLTAMKKLDEMQERGDHNMVISTHEMIDDKQEMIDHTQEMNDHTQEMIDDKQEMIDHTQEMIDHTQEMNDHKQEIIDDTHEIIDNKQEIIDDTVE